MGVLCNVRECCIIMSGSSVHRVRGLYNDVWAFCIMCGSFVYCLGVLCNVLEFYIICGSFVS